MSGWFNRPRAAFDGWPRTVMRERDGIPIGAIVSASVLTPARVRLTYALCWMIRQCLYGLALLGAYRGYSYGSVDHYVEAAIVFVAGVVSPFVAQPVLRLTMRRAVRLVFSPSTIRVERALAPDLLFDRTLPHGWRLIAHPKAERESRRLDREEQAALSKGGRYWRKPAYAESAIISLDIHNQRNAIVTMFDRSRAEMFFERLKALDETIPVDDRAAEAARLPPPARDRRWGEL